MSRYRQLQLLYPAATFHESYVSSVPVARVLAAIARIVETALRKSDKDRNILSMSTSLLLIYI
ncbi:hypothetical protein ACMX2M_19595 [Paenibacillus polymyxa]|nr:hypothetical protein MT997_08650 [Paenibacillus sp. OVF10]